MMCLRFPQGSEPVKCVCSHVLTCGWEGGYASGRGGSRFRTNTGDSVNEQIISPEGHAQPPSIPAPIRSDHMELCLVQGQPICKGDYSSPWPTAPLFAFLDFISFIHGFSCLLVCSVVPPGGYNSADGHFLFSQYYACLFGKEFLTIIPPGIILVSNYNVGILQRTAIL